MSDIKKFLDFDGATYVQYDLNDTAKLYAAAIQKKLSGGVKYDQNKVRLDLIPHEVIQALGEVLSYGAAKYGERNYEAGMDWGRPFAAAQRHLWAFWGGEDLDPESGLSHLSHALANIAFLRVYKERALGTDTRPKTRVE